MSELDILIGDRTITMRSSGTITLKPCKVKQLKEVIGIVTKYLAQLGNTENAFDLAQDLLKDSGSEILSDTIKILSICSSTEHDKKELHEAVFEDLYYDELVNLLANFIEMNKDFFGGLAKKMTKEISPEPEAESAQ